MTDSTQFVTPPKDHPSTDGVTFPDGRTVAPGEAIEVTEADAASLLEQGWTVASKAATKRAATTEADPADDTAPAGASTEGA